jgi:hypothetical protein
VKIEKGNQNKKTAYKFNEDSIVSVANNKKS